MTYTICYWDSETKSQQERHATPDEVAEIEARKVPQPVVRTRADVLADLATIDLKSIRALRENYQPRIDELEAQAKALRTELAGL
jgi:hypothetical protein